MSPEEIIRRCTREGVTAWQSVAKQLGLSVDAARSRYDPSYLRARPWPHPCESVSPDGEPEPIDETDMSSPHPKGPGLKVLILRQLQNGPASVETLAVRLSRKTTSIRARLDRLLDDFLVCHDDCYPRSWSLTAKGLRIAVTGCDFQARERV